MLIDQCPWTYPCHTPNLQNLEQPTSQYAEAWLSHLGATNVVYHHQEGGLESIIDFPGQSCIFFLLSQRQPSGHHQDPN